MNIVTILILLNSLISFQGFQDQAFFGKHLFYPYREHREKRYSPMITSSFLHSNWSHLLLNMSALAIFGGIGIGGKNRENSFMGTISKKRSALFSTMLLLSCYLGGILISNLIIYWRYRDDPSYLLVGASAGIGAIMAAAIVFVPGLQILTFFTIPVPSILYETGFLVYSLLMCNKKSSTAHLAHLVGGIYGLLFGFAVKCLLGL